MKLARTCLTVLGVAALFLGPVACAGPTVETAMTTSAKVPGGEGTVTAGVAKHGNTSVSVHVNHLAPASKVAPDATVYVVWIQPTNGEIRAIGALTVDKDLTGTLEAVTPYKQFTVLVTPEASAEVSKPTHEPVLTSAVNRQQ
jgi:hypothetical protein